MSDRILAVGDVHLGAENADVEAFNGFLDEVFESATGDEHVVLLGDVWDLVRRDPFGCAWETSETVSRIKRLSDVVPVSLVMGNHDGYLRNLDDARYDVHLHDELVLQSGDASIRFCHGNAFDRFQFDAVSGYLSGAGDRGDIDPTNGLKDPVVARGRDLVQTGKHRLRSAYDAVRGTAPSSRVPYPRRERRAHDYLATIPEDKLVYGHTHSPYVHPDNTAANPGSWKSTAPVHNTYLVVEDGELTLYQHRSSGEDVVLDAAEHGLP